MELKSQGRASAANYNHFLQAVLALPSGGSKDSSKGRLALLQGCILDMLAEQCAPEPALYVSVMQVRCRLSWRLRLQYRDSSSELFDEY